MMAFRTFRGSLFFFSHGLSVTFVNEQAVERDAIRAGLSRLASFLETADRGKQRVFREPCKQLSVSEVLHQDSLRGCTEKSSLRLGATVCNNRHQFFFVSGVCKVQCSLLRAIPLSGIRTFRSGSRLSTCSSLRPRATVVALVSTENDLLCYPASRWHLPAPSCVLARQY